MVRQLGVRRHEFPQSTLNHQSDLLLNSWESPKMYPPKLYSGPTIQSRSAARRAAQDLVLWNKQITFAFMDPKYFLQLMFEFQSIRMYYRLKMWNIGIDCGKFGFGIRLLPGPEIDSDGDCIVTACLSQVLSDIWAISVIKWKMCSFFVRPQIPCLFSSSIIWLYCL